MNESRANKRSVVLIEESKERGFSGIGRSQGEASRAASLELWLPSPRRAQAAPSSQHILSS